MSFTLSQFVSDERTLCPVLHFRLGDHHGGEGGDKAVLQSYFQGLRCGIGFLICSTTLTGLRKNNLLPLLLRTEEEKKKPNKLSFPNYVLPIKT